MCLRDKQAEPGTIEKARLLLGEAISRAKAKPADRRQPTSRRCWATGSTHDGLDAAQLRRELDTAGMPVYYCVLSLSCISIDLVV